MGILRTKEECKQSKSNRTVINVETLATAKDLLNPVDNCTQNYTIATHHIVKTKVR